MRTPIPRFLLGGPKGWKTFNAAGDCVILPGFASYDDAANYCQAGEIGIWELQGLGCDQVRDRLGAACPQALKLVAINPGHLDDFSLWAARMALSNCSR